MILFITLCDRIKKLANTILTNSTLFSFLFSTIIFNSEVTYGANNYDELFGSNSAGSVELENYTKSNQPRSGGADECISSLNPTSDTLGRFGQMEQDLDAHIKGTDSAKMTAQFANLIVKNGFSASFSKYKEVAKIFQIAVNSQVEQVWLLLKSIDRWTTSLNMGSLIVRTPHIFQTPGGERVSVFVPRIDLKFLAKLRRENMDDLPGLSGLPNYSLDFFSDPENLKHVEWVYMKFVEGSKKREANKANGRNPGKERFKDPSLMAPENLVKDILLHRIHEITTQFFTKSNQDLVPKVISNIESHKASMGGAQPNQLSTLLCEASKTCALNALSLVDVLEDKFPLTFIAWIDKKNRVLNEITSIGSIGEKSRALNEKADINKNRSDVDQTIANGKEHPRKARKPKVKLITLDAYKQRLNKYKAEAEKNGTHGGFPTVTSSPQTGALKLSLPVLNQSNIILDPKYGTTVLQPTEGDPFDTKHLNPQALTVLMLHGYGTDQSNLQGWIAALKGISKALSAHAFAPDLPFAGLGPKLTDKDPATIASFLYNFTTKLISEKISKIGDKMIHVDNDVPYAPFIEITRSASGPFGLIHDFFIPKNPVDIRIQTSFSNPYTIDNQFKFLKEEEKNGLVKNVDWTALNTLGGIFKSFLKTLESPSTTQSQLNVLSILQNTNLHILSQSDEDGGATVLQDHQALFHKITPLAHRLYLRDPLRGTSFSDQRNPNYLDYFAYLESKHHIFKTTPNVSPELGEKLFPGLPMELLPKSANQVINVNTASLGMLDYKISMLNVYTVAANKLGGTAEGEAFAHLRDQASRLKQYRSQLLPLREDGSQITFLDSQFFKYQISQADLEGVRPGSFFSHQNQMLKEFIELEAGQREKVTTNSGMTWEAYVQKDLISRLAVTQKFLIGAVPRSIRLFKERGFLPEDYVADSI